MRIARPAFVLIGLLTACSENETDTSGGACSLLPVTAGATCTELASGTWTVGGPALGMPMDATVTMDSAGCTFTFSEWSMQMDPDLVPTGGVIDGDTLALTGTVDRWSECVATIDASDVISGTCCDDGAGFDMSLAVE
jgi:hypothetical protein